MTALFWGPHFPESGAHYWGPHYPDGVQDATVVPPNGMAGVATFALDLLAGTKITFGWGTGTSKMWSGKEYRSQPLDDPRQTYQGNALLVAGDMRTARARLARFAAIGAPFLLALSFEEISITGAATGKVLPVADTTHVDWMIEGQRVVVTNHTNPATVVEATIQSFTGNTITIDVDPGALGGRGSCIAPLMPIYLDPQQGFTRHRTPNGVEVWQLNARAAVFGFQCDARKAFASLSAASGALHTAVIQAVATGPAGNALTITYVGDSALDPGNVTVVGSAYTFHFKPGVTTVLAMRTGLGAVFGFAGSFVDTATLVAGDAIGPVALAHGADKSWGSMGIGATVATYLGRPVWDRGIQVYDVANDSIQALSELVDLGGIPISIGTADAVDWGRQVMLERTSHDEWQWLKAFIAAVRGAQRAFWLPTFRADLLWVGFSAGFDGGGFHYMLVSGPGDQYGGLDAWWPSQRNQLQVQQADGTITYVQIAAVIDNHDGTLSVSVGHAFSGSPITMVSWMDLCHFESDSFDVTFNGGTFSFQTVARAVQQ